MKQITTQQTEQILAELMALNIPVKSFVGIQDLFNKLPAVEAKEPVKK